MAEIAYFLRIRFIVNTINKSFSSQLFPDIFCNTLIRQEHEFLNELVSCTHIAEFYPERFSRLIKFKLHFNLLKSKCTQGKSFRS